KNQKKNQKKIKKYKKTPNNNNCTQIFARFNFYKKPTTPETNHVTSSTTDYFLNYDHVFEIHVTEDFLKYCSSEALGIEIFRKNLKLPPSLPTSPNKEKGGDEK